MNSTETSVAVTPSGLVTVAFLKARFDAGQDHLDIFSTLVADAVARLPRDDFVVEDVQEALFANHDLPIARHAIATLLGRLAKKQTIRREGGRYFRQSKPVPVNPNLSTEKDRILKAQLQLGRDLVAYALDRGVELHGPEQALDVFLRFLEVEQIALLLPDSFDAPHRNYPLQREQLIIAEFIDAVVSEDSDQAKVLEDMVEGLVLYQASFLPELPQITRKFNDLHAYFDSPLVRKVLGYEGESEQALMRETVDLLRSRGVRCFVFAKTVDEIQRILAMYQEKLSSNFGRMSLKPVPMARHFLRKRYNASDMVQFQSLLRQNIVQEGFEIVEAPSRRHSTTLDEVSLSKRLADPESQDESEPRVLHDVDCVAAVLTLRRGREARELDNAGYLFVSDSPLVIKNTFRWWRDDEGKTEMPPIVHLRALANRAWLKAPRLNQNYKLSELVALCRASMKPSQEMWSRFLERLEELRNTGSIRSDEEVAVLVSSFSDKCLLDIELAGYDPNDIDSSSLDEVLQRVKDKYSEEFQAVNEAERSLHRKELAAIQRENTIRENRLRNVNQRAERLVEIVMWAICGVLAFLFGVGAYAIVSEHSIWWAIGAVAVFVAAELVIMLGHVLGWRERCSQYLAAKLKRWLVGWAAEEE